jgi:LysM repeat protein
MSNLRQLAAGILIALASVAIVFGSLATGLAALPTPTPTAAPASPPVSATDQPAPRTSPAATLPPPPTTCTPPPAWMPYIVQDGDNLDTLAQQTGSTPQDIAAANCLAVTTLIPDSIIYLPAVPVTPTVSPTATQTGTPQASRTPTATPIPCGPPAGWIAYIVQSGDTLYSLAQAYGTTVAALQFANCLGSSTAIQSGQTLRVPNVPTRTPVVTGTPTATASPTSPASPTGAPTEPPPPTDTPVPYPEQPRRLNRPAGIFPAPRR